MSSLLLLSSPRTPGHEYYAHARDVVAETLAGIERVIFVPYALPDHDAYTGRTAEAFRGICTFVGAHQVSREELAEADGFLVGGGNSFQLLRTLQDNGMLELIRHRVASGAPYVGVSAGTNLACPTIRTTNDMPIVAPRSLDALGLVPFQINPHFPEVPETSTLNGETRESRLKAFIEANDVPVVALRENTWLRVTDGEALLGGVAGESYARLYRRGSEAQELPLGASVTDALAGARYAFG